MDCVESHPLWRSKIIKKKLKNCEDYGRNKGKHSVQVLHCNLFFVALLVFVL